MAYTECAAPSAPGYNSDSHSECGTPSASAVPYATQVDAAPHHAPPVHVVVMQAPPGHVITQATTNEFKIDFCGCCGAPAHCCSAFFFPCVNAAYAAHHINWSGAAIGLLFFVTYWGSVSFSSYSTTARSSYDYDGYYYYDSTTTTYSTWSGVAAVCALVFVVATAILRRAVRKFDGIPGSTITDFCASIWCSCCVLSQLSAHTERVKPHRAANAAAATLPAYRAA